MTDFAVASVQTSPPKARLILEDGSIFKGVSFGYPISRAGEVVFNTGMVGYPETLTDPSYFGQILVLTYPLIGNYGVPAHRMSGGILEHLESRRIQVQGLIVAGASEEFSHWNSHRSLSRWLQAQKVPALSGVDTRTLTRKLREKGTMLGKIEFDGQSIPFYDPDQDNLVQKVSIRKARTYGSGKLTIALLDCGCKENIVRSLLLRQVRVIRLPWDYDLRQIEFDGLVISNGPGNPKMCRKVILQIRRLMFQNRPMLGICLGHQLMALAAGANTFKLKYGHRGQNQPVQEKAHHRCFVTSQNHGFAVDGHTLPDDWETWFVNLNDGTNEGMRHRERPFMSVQFHPEAAPGPVDTGFVFDEFLAMVRSGSSRRDRE